LAAETAEEASRVARETGEMIYSHRILRVKAKSAMRDPVRRQEAERELSAFIHSE